MPFRVAAIFLVFIALGRAEPPNPRVMERYKQMLVANPVEGVALERLWKGAVEGGTSEALIAEFGEKKDFAGRMILGLLLRRAGRLDDAKTALQEVAALNGGSPLPALALGALESERGKPREAAEWYAKAVDGMVSGDPRTIETQLKLGNSWEAAGELSKATEAWEQTVAIAPDNLSVRRQLASVYAAKFLYAPAIQHLTYVAERAQPAERAGAWREIARMHSAAGETDRAMEALDRAVRLVSPENWMRPELLKEIVRLAQRKNAEDELEAKWKKQATTHPNDAGAVKQLVELYKVTGNVDEQAAWLEKLTRLLPNDADLRLQLARVLMQGERLGHAIEHFDRVLAAQPENVELVFERAQIDVQRDDLDTAASRIQRLLQQKAGDEGVREKAVEFYQAHRLFRSLEEHLKADAGAGGEAAVFKLANFYFSQRRNLEGIATLQRLMREDAAVDKRVRLYSRIAETLQGHGETTAAMRALDGALAVQQKDRGLHLLRGEIESARGNFAAARAALKESYALSQTVEEREEVDAKLFETFRAAERAAGNDGRGARQKVSMAAEVEGFIRELMQEANARKDAEGWLRVARWKALNSDRASAVTFANKAADLEKTNPRPREFLAKLGSSNGDAAMALPYLRELVSLNPENRKGYLREIARLELERGEVTEALTIFKELVHTQPGDAEALGDLAMAQERNGAFAEALETWRRVVDLAQPHRKREGIASLVRVLQQLGRHREAGETMLRPLDGTGDAEDRMGRFEELLLYAKQHGLLDWLRGEFEKRRQTRADDYFTTVALARTLKLAGDKARALEMFSDAVYSAPERGNALTDLVREAEDLRRYDISIRLQEKVTRSSVPGAADDFIKLADLYFKAGDLEGAERAWTRAVRRFPREAELIRRAVEFQSDWGDANEAASLAAKVASLEPSDVWAALEWGESAYATARMDKAQTAYEKVLKLTQPVMHRLHPARQAGSPWGERGLFAGTARVGERTEQKLLLATGWRTVRTNSSVPPDGDAEPRLRAIVRLAELARRAGNEATAAWKLRWMGTMKESPTDAVWALYFGGAEMEAVREVMRMMSAEPLVEGHRKAFFWMSLESGKADELSKWLNAEARSATDREWFEQAFAAWAEAYPERVRDAGLDELFPAGNSVGIWPAAMELSRQQRFEGAIRLGERHWQVAAGRRLAIGRDLARWHLALGQIPKAKALLREVSQGGAESLESPAMLATWELFHLLSTTEQRALLEERRKVPDDGTVSARLGRVVCAILGGDDDGARTELRTLCAARPLGPPGGEESNSALRFWNYAFGIHRQLLAWNRGELAEFWWDQVLADAGWLGLLRVQKVHERVEGLKSETWMQKRASELEERRGRELKEMLVFLHGGMVERVRVMESCEARNPEALKRLAETLEDHGAFAAAATVLRRAWERDRSDPALLRKLLDAAGQAGDAELSERVRAECVRENFNPGNDTSSREFALELADLLEQRGAVEEAIEVVKGTLRREEDLRLAHRLAELLERGGRKEEAAEQWKRAASMEGGNAYARHGLAMRLETDGKFEQALKVRTLDGSGVDPQVPLLLYKLGRTEDALAAVDRLGGNDAVYASMTLAEAMGVKGEGRLACSVLLATGERLREPRSQMQLRTKLLTIPGHPPNVALVGRMQAKLRRLADENEMLGEAYFNFFEAYAERLGVGKSWKEEVETRWANGSGSLEGGAVLVRRAIREGKADEASGILEQILARPEAGHALLSKLASSAQAMRHPRVRLRIAEFEALRGWPFVEGMFFWIGLLDEVGDRERARQVLENMRWVLGFPNGAEKLGLMWLRLGDPERAREFYVAALGEGAGGPTPSAVAGMARVQIAAKRWEAAKLLLKRAFGIPGCREYGAAIEYLKATEQLKKWPEFVEELAMPASGRHEFAVALFGFYEGAGRSREAVELVSANPQLIYGGIEERRPDGSEAITCARMRGLARKTGAFDAVGEVFANLAMTGFPTISGERAALEADRAASLSEDARADLVRAFDVAPGKWEFARRLAEMQAAAGDKAEARKTLERYLSITIDPGKRQTALEMWGTGSR